MQIFLKLSRSQPSMYSIGYGGTFVGALFAVSFARLYIAVTLVLKSWIGPRFLRLRNDLYCVGWGVKLYSLSLSPTIFSDAFVNCIH